MAQSEMAKERQYDDEISLVDLASTFLRRRRVFYIVTSVFLLAGLAYALLVPSRFEYVSLVQLAEYGQGDYIHNPSSVIASLESHWLPELRASFRADNERNLPFDVLAENPEGTGLLRLTSEATAAQSAAIEEAHGQLISEVEKSQAADVQALRDKLRKQIESLEATVGMLQGTKDAGPPLAAAVEQRVALEAKLESIKPLEVLVVSREGTEPKGPAKSLLIMLAGILGAMAGVFSAFFMEFVGLVRANMLEE